VPPGLLTTVNDITKTQVTVLQKVSSEGKGIADVYAYFNNDKKLISARVKNC